MTYLLICEGACNPNIGYIDEQVRESNRSTMREDGRIPMSVDEAREIGLRSLRHTEHALFGIDCACFQCGHVRRYGVR